MFSEEGAYCEWLLKCLKLQDVTSNDEMGFNFSETAVIVDKDNNSLNKTQSKKQQAILVVVSDMWPEGIPKEILSNKERDHLIIEEYKRVFGVRTGPNPRTITRALGGK